MSPATAPSPRGPTSAMWRWWILMLLVLVPAGVPGEPSLPIPLETRTYFTEWGASAGTSRGLQPVCLDIPSNMSLCYGVGYRQMRLPNLLEHDTMAEVWQQAASWVPLVNIRCHADAQLFLCSLFSPVCLDRPIYPCRSLCEVVRRGCEGRMRAHGYPWPDMFRCEKFPQDNDMCIASQSDPGAARPPHPDSLDSEEHVVENANDECRPCKQVDTYENVLDNLCRADFAVRAKMRGRSGRNGRGAGVATSPDGDLRTARVLKASGPVVRKMVRDALPALPPSSACPACTQDPASFGGHLRGRDSYLVMGSVGPGQELEITFVLPWTTKSRAIKKAVRTFTNTNCSNPNLVSRTVIVDTYTPVEGSPMGPLGDPEPHVPRNPKPSSITTSTSTTTSTTTTSTTTEEPTTVRTTTTTESPPPPRSSRPLGRNRGNGPRSRQNSFRSRRPDKLNEVRDGSPPGKGQDHGGTAGPEPTPVLGSADFFDSHIQRIHPPASETDETPWRGRQPVRTTLQPSTSASSTASTASTTPSSTTSTWATDPTTSTSATSTSTTSTPTTSTSSTSTSTAPHTATFSWRPIPTTTSTTTPSTTTTVIINPSTTASTNTTPSATTSTTPSTTSSITTTATPSTTSNTASTTWSATKSTTPSTTTFGTTTTSPIVTFGSTPSTSSWTPTSTSTTSWTTPSSTSSSSTSPVSIYRSWTSPRPVLSSWTTPRTTSPSSTSTPSSTSATSYEVRRPHWGVLNANQPYWRRKSEEYTTTRSTSTTPPTRAQWHPFWTETSSVQTVGTQSPEPSPSWPTPERPTTSWPNLWELAHRETSTSTTSTAPTSYRWGSVLPSSQPPYVQVTSESAPPFRKWLSMTTTEAPSSQTWSDHPSSMTTTSTSSPDPRPMLTDDWRESHPVWHSSTTSTPSPSTWLEHSSSGTTTTSTRSPYRRRPTLTDDWLESHLARHSSTTSTPPPSTWTDHSSSSTITSTRSPYRRPSLTDDRWESHHARHSSTTSTPPPSTWSEHSRSTTTTSTRSPYRRPSLTDDWWESHPARHSSTTSTLPPSTWSEHSRSTTTTSTRSPYRRPSLTDDWWESHPARHSSTTYKPPPSTWSEHSSSGTTTTSTRSPYRRPSLTDDWWESHPARHSSTTSSPSRLATPRHIHSSNRRTTSTTTEAPYPLSPASPPMRKHKQRRLKNRRRKQHQQHNRDRERGRDRERERDREGEGEIPLPDTLVNF